MGKTEDVICYLRFSNAGVWIPTFIEIEFSEGEPAEYGATNEEGYEIHIPEDAVRFGLDEETQTDFLTVSNPYDVAIKKIIQYQTNWKNPPYKVTYKEVSEE